MAEPPGTTYDGIFKLLRGQFLHFNGDFFYPFYPAATAFQSYAEKNVPSKDSFDVDVR
jgi:hypothetical protein